VGPAPLEADILGPSVLDRKETGTFEAVVQRGSGHYAYEWYRQWDGSGDWLRIGRSDHVVLTMIDKSFTLEVDVTDTETGETASATKRVRYAGDNPELILDPDDDPSEPVLKDKGTAPVASFVNS